MSGPVGPSRRRPPGAATGGIRPAWLVLAVVVFCSYNTWVAWQPMNGREEIFNGYLSELSASDQPNNLFFRGGDLITAVIVLVLGIGLLITRNRPRRPRRRRWRLVAAWSLVLFGVSTFFDAFFAMDCSPTLSATCARLEETGQLSAIHYAHTFTSVGAQIGIVASLVAALIALLRAPGRQRASVIILAVLSVVEVVSLAVMMIMLAAGVPGIGYPQAVLVLVASIWFAFVAVGHAFPRIWTSNAGTPEDTFELAEDPDEDVPAGARGDQDRDPIRSVGTRGGGR